MMPPMRIVSWNMNRHGVSAQRHDEAWDYLQDELKADVALVQEAVPPPRHAAQVYRAIGDKHYDWGSAVVAFAADATLNPWTRVPLANSLFEHLKEHQLPDSHPGASAVTDITLPGQPTLTVASVYGQWEMMPGSSDMYAGPRLHRILADLTGVFARKRGPLAVVAGDFNVTTQGMRTKDNEASAVFARLRGWGLADCLWESRRDRERLSWCQCADGDDCAHVKTFRTGTHLDYVFASRALVGPTTKCFAEDTARAWSLSDHCPIVLEIGG